MKKTYENALKLLQTRRRPDGRPPPVGMSEGLAAPMGEIPSVNGSLSPGSSGTILHGVPSLVGMREWLCLLGHSDKDINNLNIIHIAGTKGKGSTCSFIRSILHAHGLRTGFPRKVGLYTSPHIRCIRERIQIGDHLITEDMFTKYFFEVWDGLSSSTLSQHSPLVGSSHVLTGRKDGMPRYLQLLALVAFHTFIREQTDAAICETHHGGEYDATNFFSQPVVTGITPIGMDHISQLGPKIENIAWHKAGIFKSGTPAFSALQKPAVAAVLRSRAVEKEVPELRFVQVDPGFSNAFQQGDNASFRAIDTAAQQMNCSLAIAIAGAYLQRKSVREEEDLSLTAVDIAKGIETFKWPGRFEAIVDDGGRSQWFLDGAHNDISVKQAVEWFAKNVEQRGTSSGVISNSPPLPRILIFTQISEERDGVALLESVADSLKVHNIAPEYIIFTTYEERQDGCNRIDKCLKLPIAGSFPALAKLYTDVWSKRHPEAVIFAEEAIEGALNVARKIGEENAGMQTLVTGSLYLVGGALNLLRPQLD